jgi:hypothetical protein
MPVQPEESVLRQPAKEGVNPVSARIEGRAKLLAFVIKLTFVFLHLELYE